MPEFNEISSIPLLKGYQKMSSDLSDYLDPVGVDFIGMLLSFDSFAKKYNLRTRGVYTHAIKGDLPVVFIDKVPFIIDFGREGLIKYPKRHMDIRESQALERELAEMVKGTDPPTRMARKRNIQSKAEWDPDFVKDREVVPSEMNNFPWKIAALRKYRDKE
jgi:hypothetical protein